MFGVGLPRVKPSAVGCGDGKNGSTPILEGKIGRWGNGGGEERGDAGNGGNL
jgi:hypothetical protein